jgi:hypothetical protein
LRVGLGSRVTWRMKRKSVERREKGGAAQSIA